MVELYENAIYFLIGVKRLRYRYMLTTAFLQDVNNFKTLRQIFLCLRHIRLRALFCKFEVNRDRRTRCTNS